MPNPLHHAALCARDLDASARFCRDGLGLEVMMGQSFPGDRPTLFGARGDQLHSIFLGDPASPDRDVVKLIGT